jgi:hypothetical protein
VVAQFFSSLNDISPLLPLLVRVLIVTAIALIAWVALSIPAFWLYRSLGGYFSEMMKTLSQTARKLRDFAAALLALCRTPIDSFVSVHAQMFSFAQENRQVRSEVERLRKSVEAIPRRIQALEVSVNEAERKFSTAVEFIQQLELPQPMNPPAAQEFTAVQIGRNRAVVTLAIALILTPALVGFNTGMLNEFFSSFWAGLEYMGVQLSLVLSCFATILEISLGAFLVLFPSRPAQLCLYIGIGFLAFVEASFYARLGQEFHWSIFDAFYGAEAPAWTKLWFAVFGPVLVIGLAFAGHALFSSISHLADQHVIRQWRAYIKRRMRSASELKTKLTDADRSKSLLGGSLTDVQTSFATTREVTGSSLSVIEQAQDAFLKEIRKAEQIRLADSRRLDGGAMLRQFIECLVFVGAIAFCGGLIDFVFGMLEIVTPFRWPLGLSFALTVALTETVILLMAGSAISRANTTLPAVEGAQPANPVQNLVGPVAGTAILAIVLLGNAFYILQEVSLLRFMILALVAAANVALFWFGTRLGMIGAALWGLAHSIGYVIAAATVATGALLLGAAWGLVGAVVIALVALAYPYSLLILRDPSASQLPLKAAA